MAGRVNALDTETRPLDNIAIAQHDIGHKRRVAALFDGDRVLALFTAMRTETVCLRPRPKLERSGRRRMVAMGGE